MTRLFLFAAFWLFASLGTAGFVAAFLALQAGGLPDILAVGTFIFACAILACREIAALIEEHR